MNGRHAILDKIKEALNSPSGITELNKDLDERINNGINLVTPQSKDDLWRQFKMELEAIAGEFYKVKNIGEAAEIISVFLTELNLNRIGISKEKICLDIAHEIEKKIQTVKIISCENFGYEERKKEFAVTEVSIVHPSYAVADVGSLVFLYDLTGTSYPHFLCDNTFVIINTNQIVANQFELFEKLDSNISRNMVFVTGPSRTADIEKVLVLGAHGPRKLIVILNSGE